MNIFWIVFDILMCYWRYIRSIIPTMSFKKSLSSPPAKQESRGHPGCTKASKDYLSLPIERKRELYKYVNYKTVDDLPIWASLEKEFHKQIESLRKQSKKYKLDKKGKGVFVYKPNEKINEKICLHQGDITALEIDAIVNAANQSCLGGGGVDGAIHRAAGRTLREECEHLNGCKTGMSKITGGHKLPARYVIHTVGPVDGSEIKLTSCYKTCLQLVLDYKIRTVAFCCIATGVYGYPNRDAAHVALHVARDFLEKHHDKVDRIIFCTFLPIDFDSYLELMATNYFPVTGKRLSADKKTRHRQETIIEEIRYKLGELRVAEAREAANTAKYAVVESNRDTYVTDAVIKASHDVGGARRDNYQAGAASKAEYNDMRHAGRNKHETGFYGKNKYDAGAINNVKCNSGVVKESTCNPSKSETIPVSNFRSNDMHMSKSKETSREYPSADNYNRSIQLRDTKEENFEHGSNGWSHYTTTAPSPNAVQNFGKRKTKKQTEPDHPKPDYDTTYKLSYSQDYNPIHQAPMSTNNFSGKQEQRTYRQNHDSRKANSIHMPSSHYTGNYTPKVSKV